MRLLRIIIPVFLLAFCLSEAQKFNGKPIYSITAKRGTSEIGVMTVEMFPAIAPKHVAYFDSLVSLKFFDSLAFHRVVPNFVIQGGDPNSRNKPRSTWGMGDPSQTPIPAEFSKVPYERGTLGAARDNDINSATSQFFISVVPTPGLNGNYTVYGRVIAGMNIADSIVNAPRDPADNPYQKIEMFISRIAIDSAKTSAPTLIQPADGTKNLMDGAQSLTWIAPKGALLYRLQVAKTADFSTPVANTIIATPSYTLPSLELGLVKYYWRVQAIGGADTSAFSPIFTFQTALSAPELVAPNNGATGMSVAPILAWKAVSGAHSYHVQVATALSFSTSSTVIDVSGIQATTLQITVPLEKAKKYYWRVAALTSDSQEGALSFRWNFTTEGANSVNETEQESALRAFPNPSSLPVSFSWHDEQAHLTEISIADERGEKIAVIFQGFSDKGTHSVVWNGTTSDGIQVQSGVYFAKLRSGEKEIVRKIVIVR